jgi:hypothetical protein
MVKVPQEALVLSYMTHLRSKGTILGVLGRSNRAKSIVIFLKCSSGTLIEGGEGPYKRSQNIATS